MRVSTNFIDFLSAIFLAQNLLTPSFLISSPSTNFYHFLPTFILLSPTFTSFYKFLWLFRNFTNFHTTFTNFHQLLPNFITSYRTLYYFTNFCHFFPPSTSFYGVPPTFSSIKVKVDERWHAPILPSYWISCLSLFYMPSVAYTYYLSILCKLKN